VPKCLEMIDEMEIVAALKGYIPNG